MMNVLFDDQVPIYDDGKRRIVSIRMESVRDTNSKLLAFQITDEKDPNFLFELKINERDFQVIRDQQNINVDFNDFPNTVIELLQCCMTNQEQSFSELSTTSR